MLAGGRFTVTGFCVFNPAAPFDPAPTIPDPDAPALPLKAREEILYRYPPR